MPFAMRLKFYSNVYFPALDPKFSHVTYQYVKYAKGLIVFTCSLAFLSSLTKGLSRLIYILSTRIKDT